MEKRENKCESIKRILLEAIKTAEKEYKDALEKHNGNRNSDEVKMYRSRYQALWEVGINCRVVGHE